MSDKPNTYRALSSDHPRGSTWEPKLVAVDADGTIVDSHDRVPGPIVAKLRQIDGLGVPIVLVTGRSWLSSQLVIDQLSLAWMYCVCNNGATVVSYPPLEVCKAETFDAAPVIEVVRGHPTTVVAVEEFGRGYKVSQPFPPGVYDLHGELRVVPLDDIACEPVSRLILRDPIATPEDFDAMVAELDLSSLYHSKGGENWLDLGADTGGKDKGLEFVAARLGINQSDVLALGDGYNDIDLLSWAGRGVALEGAPEDLLAVANDITGSFESGGTVAELERWFG